LIPVSVMVTGKATVSRIIKGEYGKGKPSRFTEVLRPIVFWNMTYQCNLHCLHCYIKAMGKQSPGELDTAEAQHLLKQMAAMKIPLVLFSGGEPLVRKDFWEIVRAVKGSPLPRLALSTNGTLIDENTAVKLKEHGFVYIGISIDSIRPEWHDEFRGVKGAFEAAVRGIENSVAVGLKVGIRTTLTRHNIEEIPDILAWCVENRVERVSLYLLDTVGRGEEIADWLPTREQLLWLANTLVEEAKKYAGKLEIQLVRSNFMGILIADMLSKTPEDFKQYLEMLEAQGDCGRKSVSIYPDGSVKPCQFVGWESIGNVRKAPLNTIVSFDNPKLKPYLEVHRHLRGSRCGKCPFRRICGGGSRSRARVLTGDPWGDDPLCPIEYPWKLAEKWRFRDDKL